MKRLRELRLKLGLSQADLEKLTGIDANDFSRYERGIVVPSVEAAQKIAKALGVTVDELLNGPDNKELEVRIIIGRDTVSNLPRIDLKPNKFIYQLKNNEPLVSLMGCIRIGTLEERQKASEEILKNYDALCQMYEQKEKAGV